MMDALAWGSLTPSGKRQDGHSFAYQWARQDEDNGWVEWVEPFGPNSEPVVCQVTTKTAIAYMRENHPELSPKQALEEFVIVNWAARKPK
jgi:hypothetical protein